MTTRLQADDLTVAATHEGEHCIDIGFGFAIGTATVEEASKMARSIAAKQETPWYAAADSIRYEPITRIRSLQFTDYGFLGFGKRCIEVTGKLLML